MALAAGAAGLTAGPAAAKSFSITQIRVDAQVLPNGNVRVTDTRTLDFSGTLPLRLLGPRDQGVVRHRHPGRIGPCHR